MGVPERGVNLALVASDYHSQIGKEDYIVRSNGKGDLDQVKSERKELFFLFFSVVLERRCIRTVVPGSVPALSTIVLCRVL